jgi:hypothetical protein
MKKLSESEVTKQIRGVLNACRLWHWKAWQGPMSQPKGVSDILGVKRVLVSDLVAAGVEEVGVIMAIEVKKEGWSPPDPGTKAYAHFCRQREFLDTIKLNGGIGFFAQSAEEVVERLGLKAKMYPLWERKNAISTK